MLATRLWWVLAYYGHEQASVLNGGWRRWVAEKRPIAFGEEPPPERAQFAARPNEELIARLTDVHSRVESGDTQVLDVRPRSWWEGSANPFANRRVGHIPGAANVDSGALLLHEPPTRSSAPTRLRSCYGRRAWRRSAKRLSTARPASGRRRVCSLSHSSAGTTCTHTTRRWPSGRTLTTLLSWSRRGL